MATKKNALTRSQKKVIGSMVDGLGPDDALMVHSLPVATFYGWFADPVFWEALQKVIRLRLMRARLEVSSCAMTAASNLVELCANNRLDIGRKACLDILSGAYLQKEPGIIVQTDSDFRKGVLRLAADAADITSMENSNTSQKDGE